MNPLFLIALLIFLTSCIKEDYPPECVPKELAEQQKSNSGGKWRWYNTLMEEWFELLYRTETIMSE